MLTTLLPSLAQNHGNIWYFGDKAGLDFNSGAPVALTDGAMFTDEGCSSIADPNTGQLLFYTDGGTFWDRNHNPMPNGSPGGWWSGSSTQAALIVPKPGCGNTYYVFSTDAGTVEFQNDSVFTFSIIDMSLNGGLGDVIIKHQPLFAPVTEKVTAAFHANGKDVWVISHEYGSDAFYSYLLTCSGLNTTPIVSKIGSVHIADNTRNGVTGQLKASPDGSRLALACGNPPIIEVFDFDKNTGKVSTPVRLDLPAKTYDPYGVEFSPNGDLLYASTAGGAWYVLLQYDLTAGSGSQISASVTEVSKGGQFPGSMQLGPDGRIYHAIYFQSYLGVVEDPNIQGTGCNYVFNGVSLGNKKSYSGLPSYFGCNDLSVPLDLSIHYADSCSESPVDFSVAGTSAWDSLHWNFDDASSGAANEDTSPATTHIYNSTGIYNVSLIVFHCDGQEILEREITIKEGIALELGPDTAICDGQNITLQAPLDAGVYLWNNGATSASISADTSGTYWVEATSTDGCISSDTVNIIFSNAFSVDLGPDTGICSGQNISLNTTAQNVAGYLWSTGDTTSGITITLPDTYYVRVSNDAGCIAGDTVVVQLNSGPAVNLGKDTSLCAGDSIMLDAGNPGAFYTWSNDKTTRKIKITETGSYYVKVRANDCTANDTITVDFISKMELPDSLVLCQGEELLISAGDTSYAFLWSTGDTTPMITVTDAGVYTVIAQKRGCSYGDNIIVTANVPPDIHLGADTTLCFGEEVILSIGDNEGTISWSTGSSANQLNVIEPGEYWVKVSNQCGVAVDSIVLSCFASLYIPNSFTPNSDGVNDVFTISGENISSFEIRVFDRWGKEVYHTEDVDMGWNGDIRGAKQPAQEDTYIYLIKTRDELGKNKRYLGHVNLIR